MAESKKSAKAGRKTSQCKAYRDSGRRELNKAKRLYRHLHRYGDDARPDPTAKAALDKISPLILKRARREIRHAGARWIDAMGD